MYMPRSDKKRFMEIVQHECEDDNCPQKNIPVNGRSECWMPQPISYTQLFLSYFLAKHAMPTQTVCSMPVHALKDHCMAVPRGERPKHLAKSTTSSPKPSHLSWSSLWDLCNTGSQGGKTQTSAGLLISFHVPWGCPVLNQVYFVNVQWDLISCLHSPHILLLW